MHSNIFSWRYSHAWRCWQSSKHSYTSSRRYSLALYSFCYTAHVVSYLRKQGSTQSQVRGKFSRSAGLGQTCLLFCHIPSYECVSRQSIPLQAPAHGGADQPPSFKQNPDMLPSLSLVLFATRRYVLLPLLHSPFPPGARKG